MIQIEEINCNKFICGIMKDTGIQVDPHTNEEECKRLVSEDLIYGCGASFKREENCLVFCDYFA